jgi:hypothetical protein
MPEAVRVLLRQLKNKPTPTTEADQARTNILTANCLAPLVQQFANSKQFMPGLFKILTPKAFRQEPQYLAQGYLHPADVHDGRGSEYMSKVSAILGADVSIDESLYASTMHLINSLWRHPMDEERLDKTIVDPMLEGRASIDGTPIWNYDENWKEHRLILHTKRQSAIELGFDDRQNLYYCVDAANEHIKMFERPSDLHTYIVSLSYNAPTTKEIQHGITLVNAEHNPRHDFGFTPGS